MGTDLHQTVLTNGGRPSYVFIDSISKTLSIHSVNHKRNQSISHDQLSKISQYKSLKINLC